MFSYTRKVQYHETDKMGITHHSNYIKWMEEARISCLEQLGIPFEQLEEIGVASPVVGLNIEYKHPSTFGDVISIEISLEKYNGVKMEIGYQMKNGKTTEPIAIASSTHCFILNNRICSLKKAAPKFHEILDKQVKTE